MTWLNTNTCAVILALFTVKTFRHVSIILTFSFHSSRLWSRKKKSKKNLKMNSFVLKVEEGLLLMVASVLLLLLGVVVEGRNTELDKFMPLKIRFCSEIKQIRSIFNSMDGIHYVYKDTEKQTLTRVKLRHNFMLDRFEWQHAEGREFFFATGTWINLKGWGWLLPMWLQVGVSRMQIAGHFENHEELFDLSHSVYWANNLEELYRSELVYFYNNNCYLEACINGDKSFFRANFLNFCRDTYGYYFFPLNSPCYLYNGTQDTHIEFLFTGDNSKNLGINPKCQRTVNAYSVKVNICSEEQRTHTYPVLNDLFPHSFSAHSKGGLFRALVFHRGTLYWMENRPTVRYRYLEHLYDFDFLKNYSSRWKEGKMSDEVRKLSERFYFAGAFVYPQYDNRLDKVYFMLLPRANLTPETVPIFRQVHKMKPMLVFEDKDLSLDTIIGRNCTRWLAHLQPAKTFKHHLFAILLLTFLVFFLLLVTLFTCDFTGRKGLLAGVSTTGIGAGSDALSDHAQSVLLDEIRKK